MKSDIVENHDNLSLRIALANNGKECLECLRISRISDVAREYSISDIDCSEQRLAFFCSEAHRNDWLHSFLSPHAGDGRNGEKRCLVFRQKYRIRIGRFFSRVIPLRIELLPSGRLLRGSVQDAEG